MDHLTRPGTEVSVCLSWMGTVSIVHAGSGCNEAVDEAWSCELDMGHVSTCAIRGENIQPDHKFKP